MTALHQIENIIRQIRGGQEKSICLCATMYKGGGNNSVTSSSCARSEKSLRRILANIPPLEGKTQSLLASSYKGFCANGCPIVIELRSL